MAKPGQAERTRAALVPVFVYLGAVLLLVALYADSPSLENQFDDAYITYRYAAQLASGNGLVFNVGERVDSASSLSYVLLLSAFHRAGAHDLEEVALLLGIASTAGVATTVFAAIRRLTGLSALAVAFGWMTALHGLMSGWAVSGMEAAPFSLIVALVVHLHFVLGERGTRVTALLCLAVSTRVEGWLLVLVVSISTATDLASSPRALRIASAFRIGAIAAVGAAFFAFKFLYYGTLLPDSYAFKGVALAYQPQPLRVMELWHATTSTALMLGVAGLAMMPDRRKRNCLALYLCVSIISVLRGPWSEWGRYSIHLLPCVMLLAALCVAELLRNARALAFAALAFVGIQTAQSALSGRRLVEGWADHQRCRKEIGQRLAAHSPEGPVLSSDVGAIAYEAMNVTFVDAAGLTSPDVLSVYLDGGSLDSVLEDRRPSLVADTYVERGGGAAGTFQAVGILREPSQLTTRPVAASTFIERRRVGDATVLCRTPDGLVFAIAPLGEPGD